MVRAFVPRVSTADQIADRIMAPVFDAPCNSTSTVAVLEHTICGPPPEPLLDEIPLAGPSRCGLSDRPFGGESQSQQDCDEKLHDPNPMQAGE